MLWLFLTHFIIVCVIWHWWGVTMFCTIIFLNTTTLNSGKVFVYKEKNLKFPDCFTIHFIKNCTVWQCWFFFKSFPPPLQLRVMVIISLILVFLCSRYFLMAVFTWIKKPKTIPWNFQCMIIIHFIKWLLQWSQV